MADSSDTDPGASTDERREWMFLTNHGNVLVCIDANPKVRLREIASIVGITERTAQRIVVELVDAGYVRLAKVGRRNHYEVDGDQPLRHRAPAPIPVERLLHVFRI